MELRQLEYFLAVVDEASFTRAAARVRVAQPGVSAQVRRLERELGQPLLDRTGRSVRLTEAGAAVLPYARAALAAVAGARRTVDELAGLLRGHVAIGTVTACAYADLSEILAGFHAAHPGVEIRLSEDTSDRLLDGLRGGDLDLALVGLSTAPPQGIATQTIVDESLVLGVSHDDPFAGRTAVTLKAATGRPLISLPRGTGLRTCFDHACAAAGLEPRIAFEASDLRVLTQLASRGLGAAILPESTASAHADQLHVVALTRPRLRSRMEFAWRTDGPISPAARALVRHTRRFLGRSAA